MKYIATIMNKGVRKTQKFGTLIEAAQWLDAENKDLTGTILIETLYEPEETEEELFGEENGRK